MTVGWRTLDDGEQALVYDLQGGSRVEEGPKRLFLFREKFKLLQRFSANQSEFIVIRNKQGHIYHSPGPCVVFKNPVVHESVTIKDGISLDANEVIVSYVMKEKTNKVDRQIRYGPTLFIQQANEWLHEFVWHGKDPQSKTRKIPRGLRFTKLRVIPDQFYYNVEEVRTSDDAVITVKLMIFYELKDIEQMLNSTQDPIGDFINCLSADVVAYASKLTYMEFIENSGELNDITRYQQTLERSKAIGYDVTKVVYRGYHADDKLDGMHNKAVSERANLKIDFEREEQQQDVTDFQLHRERERISTEQSMELESLEHRQKMEKANLEHKLALQAAEKDEKIKQWTAQKQSTIWLKESEDNQKVSHFKALKKMSVDLTEYLTSLMSTPEKTIRVLVPENSPNAHLHYNLNN